MEIKSNGVKVEINGEKFKGRHVQVINGKVTIDGKPQAFKGKHEVHGESNTPLYFIISLLFVALSFGCLYFTG